MQGRIFGAGMTWNLAQFRRGIAPGEKDKLSGFVILSAAQGASGDRNGVEGPLSISDLRALGNSERSFDLAALAQGFLRCAQG